MTFRAHLERARCLSNRDVGEVSSSSSSGVGPDDSASARQCAGSSTEGAVMMNGASLDAVMSGYSEFMIAALKRAEPAAVGSIVDVYSSVISSCLAAGMVATSSQPISVVGNGSGISVRSGSWLSTRPSRCDSSASKVRSASRAMSSVLPGYGSTESGLCYLKFVAKGCRSAARKCIGTWPTVAVLLRSPAELFDMSALESHKLTQVSSDTWHAEPLGNWSVQLSAKCAFSLSAHTSEPADRELFLEGSLGHRLLLSGVDGGAARVVPLSHRIGGDVEAEYRIVDPPADWSWSKQFKWCDANSNCRLYWKHGACLSVSCSALHVRVSPVRLRLPQLPECRWTKSQKIKWCKYNGFCWRKFSTGSCVDSSCVYSHSLSAELLDRVSGSTVVSSLAVPSVSQFVAVGSPSVVPSVSQVEPAVSAMGALSVVAGAGPSGLPGTNYDIFPFDGVYRDAYRSLCSGSFIYSPHLVTDVMFVDCEMMTADRVLPQGRSILGRVSVVNCFGQVVYDTFVYPEDCSVANTNYTWGSGIRRVDIAPGRGAVPFSVARGVVLDCFSSSTMVGFAVHNDLKVLRITPGMLAGGLIDVQKHPFYRAAGLKSLKFLALKYLRKEVQVAKSHSSVEDALTTMQLFVYLYKKSLVSVGTLSVPLFASYASEYQRVVSADSDLFGHLSVDFVRAYAPGLREVIDLC